MDLFWNAYIKGSQLDRQKNRGFDGLFFCSEKTLVSKSGAGFRVTEWFETSLGELDRGGIKRGVLMGNSAFFASQRLVLIPRNIFAIVQLLEPFWRVP